MRKDDKYFYDIAFIKERMAERKLKGTGLAKLSGVKYEQIKSILNFRQRPTIDSMARINKALGITNGKYIAQYEECNDNQNT